MPDFWTHIITGERILDKTAEEQELYPGRSRRLRIIRENLQLYRFGCQGPDFFFYHHFWPWVRDKRGNEAGRRLQQEETVELFITGLELLQSAAGRSLFPLLSTYVSGFLAHYVLDRWAHPFIHQRSANSAEHKSLEILIDCYFVEKYWDEQAYLLPPVSEIDLGENLPDYLIDWYGRILAQVYGYQETDFAFINDSYQDMKQALGIIYCPTPLKRGGLLVLNGVVPFDLSVFLYPAEPDYSRLAPGEWSELEGLVDQAVSEGCRLNGLIEDYLAGRISREKFIAGFPDTNFDGRPFKYS